MNSTIFFMFAVMIPAVANAGLQATPTSIGDCTESPRKESADHFRLLDNFRPNEMQRPIYSMKLMSTPTADGKKAHLTATLSTKNPNYLLIGNTAQVQTPGQLQTFGDKNLWTKDFDAKADARGQFTSSDNSSITMTKSTKRPGEDYNDSAMVFDPQLAGVATYQTSVLYKEGPTWFALDMTCKVNEEQLAQVDGTFDSLRIHADKHWMQDLPTQAGDAVQCKEVAPKLCSLDAHKKTETYTPAE